MLDQGESSSFLELPPYVLRHINELDEVSPYTSSTTQELLERSFKITQSLPIVEDDGSKNRIMNGEGSPRYVQIEVLEG